MCIRVKAMKGADHDERHEVLLSVEVRLSSVKYE